MPQVHYLNHLPLRIHRKIHHSYRLVSETTPRFRRIQHNSRILVRLQLLRKHQPMRSPDSTECHLILMVFHHLMVQIRLRIIYNRWRHLNQVLLLNQQFLKVGHRVM